MARAGEEDLELYYTAEFRTHPPPQAAGTVYFTMDVDDVPVALGSRPDRLSEVRPQERHSGAPCSRSSIQSLCRLSMILRRRWWDRC